MADVSIKIVTGHLSCGIWTEEVTEEMVRAVRERSVMVTVIFGDDQTEPTKAISPMDPDTLRRLNQIKDSAFLHFYDLKRRAKRHMLIVDDTSMRLERYETAANTHDQSVTEDKDTPADIIQYNSRAARRALRAFEELFAEAKPVQKEILFADSNEIKSGCDA